MKTTKSKTSVLAASWCAALIVFTTLAADAPETAQQTPPPNAGRQGAAPPQGQARGRGPAPVDTLGTGPWDLSAGRGGRIHVSIVTKGLDHPWGIAFLPSGPSTPLGAGEMLVTERPGRLRVIRNGVLDPTPIGPLPQMLATGLGGLLDVSLHPRLPRIG